MLLTNCRAERARLTWLVFLTTGDLTMYRPNFCSECGTKTVRLHWHLWTSRRFCNGCARKLWTQRVRYILIVASALLSAGFIAGRATRSDPPPLIIERAANSPLFNSPEANSDGLSSPSNSVTANVPPAEVYICGARTKKGKPCSRRVHGPVRCWQHKGAKAMLLQERLLVHEGEQ